jgi:uncharacterized protein (TIGR02145 family)
LFEFYLSLVLYIPLNEIARLQPGVKVIHFFTPDFMSKNQYLFFVFAVLISLSGCRKDPNNVLNKDIDGNVYDTISIGSQVWMKENLNVTKYNDGTSVQDDPGFSDYNFEPANSEKYGKLYGGYVADADNPKNICPVGWHVPSDNDWTILTTYLGGEDIAGGKLKEDGTIHWSSPNTGATNESGFNALPGGGKGGWADQNSIGSLGEFWTSTYNYDAMSSRYEASIGIVIYNNSTNIATPRSAVLGSCDGCGKSVRCMKDNN